MVSSIYSLAAQAAVGAPAPFPKPDRGGDQPKSYYDGALKLTPSQQKQLSGNLQKDGLDFTKGTARDGVVYFGEDKKDGGFGAFMDKKGNVVMTGGKANSPSGVNGAGYAIDPKGQTVERSDISEDLFKGGGPGAAPAGGAVPGGPGGPGPGGPAPGAKPGAGPFASAAPENNDRRGAPGGGDFKV
jgi:hypothetical protein